ncbi:MAG: DUF2490 domain-containing protein [Myxococcales bacterium]|jgi:hypothetical protein|nr:DUF2490 domain-containing protein [Myxococcales bacterium]
MRAPLALATIATLVLLGTRAEAQQGDAPPSSFQSFTELEMRADLESLVPRLHFDVHGAARRAADVTEARARLGLGVRLNGWAILSAGYAWAPTFVDEGPDFRENRFFQRLTARFASSRAEVFAEGRLEQRFSPDTVGAGWASSLAARGALRLGPTGFWVLVEQRAIFQMNDTDSGLTAGLEEHRLFGGFAYDLGPRTILRFGYMHRYMPMNATPVGHVLFVGPRMAFRTGR